MDHIECKCGETFLITQLSNNLKIRVYTDFEWDIIFENDTIETNKFPLPKYDIYMCPKCERIYVFDDIIRPAIKIYCLEK